MYKLLRYHQTKSNSISVHILCFLNKTKEFEEFLLIGITYSDSRINTLDFKNGSFDFYNDLDVSILSEFNCIAL